MLIQAYTASWASVRSMHPWVLSALLSPHSNTIPALSSANGGNGEKGRTRDRGQSRHNVQGLGSSSTSVCQQTCEGVSCGCPCLSDGLCARLSAASICAYISMGRHTASDCVLVATAMACTVHLHLHNSTLHCCIITAVHCT